jgi:hypothetical protein
MEKLRRKKREKEKQMAEAATKPINMGTNEEEYDDKKK